MIRFKALFYVVWLALLIFIVIHSYLIIIEE